MSWRTAFLCRLAYQLQRWSNRLLATVEPAAAQPGQPPADWLARTQPAAPPAHWLQRVQQLTPGQPPAELWLEDVNRREREGRGEEGRREKMDVVAPVERVVGPLPRPLRFRANTGERPTPSPLRSPASEDAGRVAFEDAASSPLERVASEDATSSNLVRNSASSDAGGKVATRPPAAPRTLVEYQDNTTAKTPAAPTPFLPDRQPDSRWPDLLEERPADSIDGEEVWRAWQRRQRLEREQRGVAWNELPS
jgi:hypothetical protein